MRYAQPALAFVALLALTACDALTDPPNRAPTAGQIPLQTVHVGERRSLDLSGYFADPDGDALTFTAESGHPGLLSVSVSGSTLELAALRQGAATVKVTATDPDGLAASSHMDVVIPNRAPVVMATVADQRLPGPGRTVEVDVSGVFADPDGDALTIEAESGGHVGCRRRGVRIHVDAGGQRHGGRDAGDADSDRSGRAGGLDGLRGGGEPGSSGDGGDSVANRGGGRPCAGPWICPGNSPTRTAIR